MQEDLLIGTADASRLRQSARRALEISDRIVPDSDSEPCAESGQGSKQKNNDNHDEEKSQPTLPVNLKVNSWDVDDVQYWASEAGLDDAILTTLEAEAYGPLMLQPRDGPSALHHQANTECIGSSGSGQGGSCWRGKALASSRSSTAGGHIYACGCLLLLHSCTVYAILSHMR